jgi:hypothetical protein
MTRISWLAALAGLAFVAVLALARGDATAAGMDATS